MSETSTLERVLKRERAITLAGLVVGCALAWIYIAMGAGLGTKAWDMTTLALFPHQHVASAMAAMPDMPDMPNMAMSPADTPWGLAIWILTITMWWIMMIAMMTPSAAPTILLYARVYRRAPAQDPLQSGLAPTGAFAGGYLLVWLIFSVLAAALQRALQRAGLVSSMMDSQSRWLSGAVLIAAGLYQLCPLKASCLAHCRTPTAFLSKHWRPKAYGALRLGVIHGAYCVGCCWMLMALLFVGGVMNLVWIVALALLVLIEKLLPQGRWVSRGAGAAVIAWGIATLLSPAATR